MDTNNGGMSLTKTLVIVGTVIGCFAVLWPSIFYPMILGSLKKSENSDGCCDLVVKNNVRDLAETGSYRYFKNKALNFTFLKQNNGTPRDRVIRPGMLHPGLSDRARSIPSPPSLPKTTPSMGVRPPLGGTRGIPPGHSAPSSMGTMGIVLPLYTVAILIFFGYTMIRVAFRRKTDENPVDQTDSCDFSFEKEYQKFMSQMENIVPHEPVDSTSVLDKSKREKCAFTSSEMTAENSSASPVSSFVPTEPVNKSLDITTLEEANVTSSIPVVKENKHTVIDSSDQSNTDEARGNSSIAPTEPAAAIPVRDSITNSSGAPVEPRDVASTTPPNESQLASAVAFSGLKELTSGANEFGKETRNDSEDVEIESLQKRLAETEATLERIMRQINVVSETLKVDHRSESPNGEVRILSMDTTESCARRLPVSESSHLPPQQLPPCALIMLDGARRIPHDSQLLVVTQREKHSEAPESILESKLTLSVIPPPDTRGGECGKPETNGNTDDDKGEARLELEGGRDSDKNELRKMDEQIAIEEEGDDEEEEEESEEELELEGGRASDKNELRKMDEHIAIEEEGDDEEEESEEELELEGGRASDKNELRKMDEHIAIEEEVDEEEEESEEELELEGDCVGNENGLRKILIEEEEGDDEEEDGSDEETNTKADGCISKSGAQYCKKTSDNVEDSGQNKNGN